MIKDLPQKLRSLRERYRYSQKDVANKLGVSPSIVSGYETGERTPSTEELLSLAYLYKCSTDYLLGRQSSQPQAVINAEGLTDRQIAAITQLVESIRESN